MKTTAPGNQPTGMRPKNPEAFSRGLKAMTATAFCVPLQTKSRLPV